MAYLPNQGATEEEDKLGVNAPMVTSGGGTVASGGGGGPGQPQPTRSGSFTNLQSYVRQNTGGAPALGERVAANIAAKGAEAREALSGASQSFNTAAQSKTPTIDETLLQKSLATPQALSPEEIQTFNQQRFATYGGPTQIQDVNEYGQAMAKVQGAENYGSLLENEAGRQQLVGELYGNRIRGPGMLALDAYLLQRTPEALQAAQQGRETLGTLGAERQAAEEAARAQAEAAQAGAGSVRDRYQQAFFGPGGAIETTGAELGERAKQQSDAAIKAQQDAQRFLENLGYVYTSGRADTSFDPGMGLPGWAESIGLDETGYQNLVTALQGYGVFDYSGVNPWREYTVSDPRGGNVRTVISPIAPDHTLSTGKAIKPDPADIQKYMMTQPIDLARYASMLPEDIIAGRYTPETVASNEERARLAALENLLGTDISYYSGAAGTPESTVGGFDLDSAMQRINELAERMNNVAYLQYMMRNP